MAAKNVELVTRDLLSRQDRRKAAEGVSMIYHLAETVVALAAASKVVCVPW